MFLPVARCNDCPQVQDHQSSGLWTDTAVQWRRLVQVTVLDPCNTWIYFMCFVHQAGCLSICLLVGFIFVMLLFACGLCFCYVVVCMGFLFFFWLVGQVGRGEGAVFL